MNWTAQFDALLKSGARCHAVDDQIYSVMTDGRAGFYDNGAWLYDAIVGGRMYNRLVWGCPVSAYQRACTSALAHNVGPVIDVGCGSLVFTADLYAAWFDRLIVLVDRSVAMLRRARDRLRKAGRNRLENIILLQADATCLPFIDGAFGTVMSWGVLHVMPDAPQFMAETARVTHADGKLCLSSLVTDRRFGRPYLRLLAASGEVAALRSTYDVQSLAGGYGQVELARTVGNMAFLTARIRTNGIRTP